MSSKFCPKCGATEKGMVDGFCVDCYVKDHPGLVDIPKWVEIDSCPQCLRVWWHSKWVSGRESNVVELITEKVKTKLENAEIKATFHDETPKGSIYLVEVSAKVGNHPYTFSGYTEVRIAKRQCEICGKKDSTYYEALIQLRPKGREADLDKMRDAFHFLRNENRAAMKEDRKAEIFRFEEAHNGINLYFGSHTSARSALQKFMQAYKPEVKESYKLMGVTKKTGRERYSVTYSVRI